MGCWAAWALCGGGGSKVVVWYAAPAQAGTEVPGRAKREGQGGRDARVPDVVAEGYYEDVDPEEERRRIEEWLEERHPCGLL